MSLEFRNANLWENESSGFACNGNARIIIEKALKQFGVGGRIFEIFAGNEPADIDVSHSYVVLDNQTDQESALNQPVGTEPITVGQAKQSDDITAEIMNAPWKTLR